MGAPALAAIHVAAKPRGLAGIRGGVAAVGAAVLGAAPHVLHHVGPLAGAALLRRRTGSWRVQGGALALMAAVFAFSSLVVGPALTARADEQAAPARNVPAAPAGASPDAHYSHHR